MISAPADSWSDAATWSGDGLRREVFFFRSRGVELYGSLFAAAEISRPLGVVACNSWGVEADRCDPLQRAVVLEMARLGGAGMVFHYPGFGDSYGELAELGLADLSEAAVDAVAEAAQRCPDVDWILAGFVLGASIACLAQRQAAIERLLLVQPSLRPGAYFQKLASSRRPLAPGPSPREMMEVGTAPGMAYGYPIPKRIAQHAAVADTVVAAAVEGFGGNGVTICQGEPEEVGDMPEDFERVTVSGTWRFGSQNHPQLAAAVVDWLVQHTGGDVR